MIFAAIYSSFEEFVLRELTAVPKSETGRSGLIFIPKSNRKTAKNDTGSNENEVCLRGWIFLPSQLPKSYPKRSQFVSEIGEKNDLKNEAEKKT